MPPANTNAGKANDERVNILLVDDRPDKLLTFQVMLAELDQNLVSAQSGKEALRFLLNQDFAVILLDVNMPGMDGFETASLIRRRPRSQTTPIIFVSAINDTDTHVSRGYSLGAVDYILAPVIPEILRAKVAVFVDLYKKSEQIKKQGEVRAQFLREQAARAEAESAQERMTYLAEAGRVLSSSLERQRILENVAHLIVPRLADFCMVDILDEEGRLRQVAAAHRDPEQEARLRGLDCDSERADGDRAATRVLKTGKPEVCSHVTIETLSQLFPDCADPELVLELEPVSYVVVPLHGRDRVLGAVTLVNSTPQRSCGLTEVSLADELARRATIALENAMLYESAQQALIQAEQANAAKDQFLAMLSHELRTPLTPVLGTVLGLESEENLSEDLRGSIRMIRRNIELEARLIDDLLDLTRVSKGKLKLSFEAVDAHDLLSHAIEICQPEITSKRLVLRKNLDAQVFHLRADSARLQQIFWNLLKNAIKFTPVDGEIVISTRNPCENELEVEIADTGHGIEPELLPRIFKPFEQGEGVRKGGLGLGLAITKALVELHNGSIVAKSEGRGRGAAFTLQFVTVERPAKVEPSSLNGNGQRRTFRILLVEDHDDSNRSLTALLRRRGYEVHPTWDVASALEYASHAQFDVLISDMGLPDGTGTEIMEKLGDRPILGIALSGFGMESDIRRSHDAGFQYHLIKPVDLNKLDTLLQQSNVEVPKLV